MSRIAVFDFDGTLYRKDSLVEFTKFVYKKNPFRLRYLPVQILFLVLYKLSTISAGMFKEKFLCFLNGAGEEQLQSWLDVFWRSQPEDNFNSQLLARSEYLASQGIIVVCISASPRRFIADQLERLGIHSVIATEIEQVGGRYHLLSENCRGQEKIKRMEHLFYSGYELVEAYSDNSDDIHLLLLAQNGFIVNASGESEAVGGKR